MIRGGAKKPALLRYLPKLKHSHFAYVGSVFGSGAWAVAEACAELGFQSTLFIARSDYSPAWLPSIQGTGAKLVWCDPQPVAALHDTIIEAHPDLYHLPLGFDNPDFISDMADALRASIPIQPTEIWLPALSGVLARAACTGFPSTGIHAVCAAKNHGNIGHATPYVAPEKFHRPAITLPPYPACPFSDAKLWQFVQKKAVSGAFILNVGI